MAFSRERAEILGVNALGWLIDQEDHLLAFLSMSGAGIDDLRSRVADPEFLGAVMDFILTDDSLVVSFAESQKIKPEMVFEARQALPGGDLPNWT